MTKNNDFSITADWMTVNVSVSAELSDAVTNFLHESGSPGLSIDDNDPEVVIITAYLPKVKWDAVNYDFKEYLKHLGELFPQTAKPSIKAVPLKRENWAVAWQSRFKPLKVGKNLLITPPWLKPDPGARRTIIIEPAEAFGTGTHETTQGCLRLLESALETILKRNQDVSLLDVGCGSGILAIAGVKLGATRVQGIDNDPVAVRSAQSNAALNQLQDKITFECMSLKDCSLTADIIVANLDPLRLMENRAKLLSLCKSCLIISGVPLNQWVNMKKTFLSETIVLKKEITRKEWGAGLFRRT
jgi:ribosomal protein L11 methyltransferase